MIGARQAWRAAGRLLLALALASSAAHAAAAADLGPFGMTPESGAPTARYFPRGDGIESDVLAGRSGRRIVGCRPRQVPVPTNAPDDPSYVGSEYGLSRPSYYGFTPPRGIDDPYGRPVLGYCR